MTRREKIQCSIFALILLLFSVVTSALNSRLFTLKCIICNDVVHNLSIIEYYFGPFEKIAITHPVCNTYIATYLAPNSDMTIGEWLSIRGYDPVHNELKEQAKEIRKNISDELSGE
jgi:hypothetical protein